MICSLRMGENTINLNVRPSIYLGFLGRTNYLAAIRHQVLTKNGGRPSQAKQTTGYFYIIRLNITISTTKQQHLTTIQHIKRPISQNQNNTLSPLL